MSIQHQSTKRKLHQLGEVLIVPPGRLRDGEVFQDGRMAGDGVYERIDVLGRESDGPFVDAQSA